MAYAEVKAEFSPDSRTGYGADAAKEKPNNASDGCAQERGCTHDDDHL